MDVDNKHILIKELFTSFGLTEDGKLPTDKVCPFIEQCGENSKNCGGNKVRTIEFSCAKARGFCFSLYYEQ